jgi:hypothetical protein
MSKVFYLAIYFINEAAKKPLATVGNTKISEGTLRSRPLKFYVGKTFLFDWGTKAKPGSKHLAKVLFTR